MIYFSEFSPLPTLPGVKGTTSALLSTSSYNALVVAFSAIGDDNKLTAVEKQQVIREHTSNISVNSSLVIQATSLGITTELTAYQTAYSDLNIYLATLSPVWNDTATTTDIVRTTWSTYWSDLYKFRLLLQVKVSQKASESALWSSIYGPGKADDNATRNVPAGNHSTASTYSRGDLVTNAANTASYIAKQAVPLSIAITNTVYWDLFVQGSGSPGQSAFQPYLSNNPITIPTAADGTGGNFSTAIGQYKLWEGTTDRTLVATYVIVGSPTWVSINSVGVYTVTDPGVDRATAQFDASYAGTTHRLTLQVVKQKSGVNGTNGTPGTNGTNGITFYTWTAYANSLDGTINFTNGNPAGRVFRGEALNQTSAIESTNPALYTWSRYTGPAMYGLAGLGAVSIGTNFVVKTGITTAWDASVYSTENFTNGCYASAGPEALGLDTIFGINSDPITDADFASIDYVWNAAANNNWYIYESGSPILLSHSVVIGQNPSVSYNGKTVEYRKHDGTLVRSVATTANRSFWFDSSIYTPTAKLIDIRWLPMGAAGSDGTNGLNGTTGIQGPPGNSGTNGTNGLTQRIHFAYADSVDGTVNFTTGAIGSRVYIGTLIDFEVADSINPAAYTWSYLIGQNGINGTRGADGANGQPSYVHTAYSNTVDGTVDFDLSDPIGRKYLGIYSDQNIADSTNPASYAWSLIKGTDGITPPVILINPTTIIVLADQYTIPKIGQLPKYINVSARVGGVPTTITSLTKTDTSCSSTVLDSNNIQLDNMSGNTASILISAVCNGQTVIQTVTISKQSDVAPASTQSLSGGVTNNTTYTTVLTGTATTKSSGIIRVFGFAQYRPGSGFNVYMLAKLRYRIPGGSFIDVASATGYPPEPATRSIPGEPGGPAEPGYVIIPEAPPNYIDLNLSGNTSYEIDFQLARVGPDTVNLVGSPSSLRLDTL